MPQWELFAALVVLTTIALLVLARESQQLLTNPSNEVASESGSLMGSGRPPLDPTPGWLLGNVLLSHGLLGALIIAGGWYAEIPLAAVGLGDVSSGFLSGIGLGIVLAAGNEVAAVVAKRVGVDHDERLRELLAPESIVGWFVLVGGVLPVIAFVEELLFRAALIGAMAAGFGLPVWGLAIVSSVLFGLGHGLQGPGGVLVTGGLGFVLASAFIVSGSLVVVVVAHYCINLIEFVLHEAIGLDPGL